MSNTSTNVCPFCAATCPGVGDEEYESYGDFTVFRCACGALGSHSGDILDAAWPLEEVEAGLAAILKSPRERMEITLTHVTSTNPPMVMLWGRKRKP